MFHTRAGATLPSISLDAARVPTSQERSMPRTGRFAGPAAGLRFETPSCSGVTDRDGTFEYRDGEVVTFSIGALVIGAARGADRLTIADIVARVDGDVSKLADPGLTNIARFLLTLDQDGNS